MDPLNQQFRVGLGAGPWVMVSIQQLPGCWDPEHPKGIRQALVALDPPGTLQLGLAEKRQDATISRVSEAAVHSFFSPSLSIEVVEVGGVEQETEKPLKTFCIVLMDPLGQLLQCFPPQTNPTGLTTIPLEQSYGLLLSC